MLGSNRPTMNDTDTLQAWVLHHIANHLYQKLRQAVFQFVCAAKFYHPTILSTPCKTHVVIWKWEHAYHNPRMRKSPTHNRGTPRPHIRIAAIAQCFLAFLENIKETISRAESDFDLIRFTR